MGVGHLREVLAGVVDNLEHRKAGFPEEWFRIKEELASKSGNYMKWDDYQVLCQESGEQDPVEQKRLSGYMHSLGIALNYSDDPRLKDTHVLKPRWVTEGIYSILRAGQEQGKERLGVLDLSDPESGGLSWNGQSRYSKALY